MVWSPSNPCRLLCLSWTRGPERREGEKTWLVPRQAPCVVRTLPISSTCGQPGAKGQFQLLLWILGCKERGEQGQRVAGGGPRVRIASVLLVQEEPTSSYKRVKSLETVSQTQMCHTTQHFHASVSTREKWRPTCTRRLAHGCSEQPESPEPRMGSNPRVHQPASGQTVRAYPCDGTLLGNSKDRTTPYATTWTGLKNTLIERSQTREAADYMIPFTRNVRNRQVYRDAK